MKITIVELAQHAGVSRATASLVIRNSPLVAEKTRARVLASMAEIGYVYNRGAASLRTQRTQTVGLMIVQITDPFYAELVLGAETALDRADMVPFIANTAESPVRQRRLIDRMHEQNVDGIILCPAVGTPPELMAELKRSRLPCVNVLRSLPDSGADFAGTDSVLGAEMATQHLISLGHRNIAFIGGGFQTSTSADRLAGYKKTLVHNGISINEDFISSCPSSRAGSSQAIQRIMQSSNKPTAAVCFNDVVAFGVMLGLNTLKIRPGIDFAIVGFDNIAEASLCQPGLTTIAINPSKIGEEAASLLLRRIANPEGEPEHIITPPHLVIRDSCGANLKNPA